MCGHATLAIIKVALETGLIKKEGQAPQEMRLNSPAGTVYARAMFDDKTGEVTRTSLRNVTSFVYQQHQTVAVPGLGDLTFDVSFGGVFCAIVSLGALPISQRLEITPANYNAYISLGQKIRTAILCNLNIVIRHPVESDRDELLYILNSIKSPIKLY